MIEYNIKFPYSNSEDSGLLDRNTSLLKQYQSRFLMLLYLDGTVMYPNKGIGIQNFVFDPNDTSLAGEIRNKIIEQTEVWLPEIFITDIWIDTAKLPEGSIDKNAAMINITWGPRYNVKNLFTLRTPMENKNNAKI